MQFHRHPAFVSIASFTALVLSGTLVFAAPVYVAPTGSDVTGDGTVGHPYATLQRGLDEAAAGDEVLALAGTYTGAGNRALEFGGKAVTLRGASGAAATIIDCERAAPALLFIAGERHDSAVEDLTITGGKAALYAVEPGGGLAAAGGAIFCDGTSPTIRRCILYDNLAQADAATTGSFGGAIYARGSGILIEDSILEANRSTTPLHLQAVDYDQATKLGGGGAIFATGDSAVRMVRCKLVGNRVDSILPNPATRLGFQANCGWGGGILALGASLDLDHCWFDGNSAGIYETGVLEIPAVFGSGGGIAAKNSAISLDGCTFTANKATAGSAVQLMQPSPGHILEALNCTFSRNISWIEFAYIDVYQGTAETPLRFRHCTFNSEMLDCAMPSIVTWFGRRPRFENCAFSKWDTFQETFESGGGNVIEYEPRCFGAGPGPLLPGDVWVKELRMAPAALNGGIVPTCALLPGSPAIDFCTDGTTTVDQRGEPRPVEGDGLPGVRADAGTFEKQSYTAGEFPFVFVSGQVGDDTTGDGTDVHPYATLQKGIDAAGDGYTIVAAPGVYKGTGNRNLNFHGKRATLKLGDPVGDAVDVVIDCEGAAPGFVFRSGEGPATVLDQITVKNGRALLMTDPVTGRSGYFGGGIYCEGSSPTLRTCWITDCVASSGDPDIPAGGGGIYAVRSGISVTGTISENIAELSPRAAGVESIPGGGGLLIEGGSVLRINGCRVFVNHTRVAAGDIPPGSTLLACGSGAGIAVVDSDVEWIGSGIEENYVDEISAPGISAPASGGGIWGLNARIRLERTYFEGNGAPGPGGDIHIEGTSPPLEISSSLFLGSFYPYTGEGGISGSANFDFCLLWWWDYEVGLQSGRFTLHGCIAGDSYYPVRAGEVTVESLGYNIINMIPVPTLLATDLSGVDPMLQAEPATFRPLPGSPAIDFVPTGGPAVDFHGDPRPTDGDGNGSFNWDAGPVEAAGPLAAQAPAVADFLLGKSDSPGGADRNLDQVVDIADLVRAAMDQGDAGAEQAGKTSLLGRRQ